MLPQNEHSDNKHPECRVHPARLVEGYTGRCKISKPDWSVHRLVKVMQQHKVAAMTRQYCPAAKHAVQDALCSTKVTLLDTYQLGKLVLQICSNDLSNAPALHLHSKLSSQQLQL